MLMKDAPLEWRAPSLKDMNGVRVDADLDSLAGQRQDAARRLADNQLEPGGRIVVEGVAEDGTIEAIRIADAPAFALGVQWHAEYDPQTNPINRTLFEAFGAALHEHVRS